MGESNELEVKERALRYINILSEGLHLEHSPYTNIDEIKIENLVEINCRLLGLSFHEYIPTKRPWEDVERIILSLQERFGPAKFKHLLPKSIAAGNILHLTCLLQILNTIFQHGKKKGRKFLPISSITQQRSTMLDDSGNGRESLLTEASTNGTTASGSTIEELKFNFILDDSDEITDDELAFVDDVDNIEDSAISSINDDHNDSDFQFYEPNNESLEKQLSTSRKAQPKNKSKLNPVIPAELTTSRSIRKSEKEPTFGRQYKRSRNLKEKQSNVQSEVSKRPNVIATGTIFEKMDQNQREKAPKLCELNNIEDFIANAQRKLKAAHLASLKLIELRLQEIVHQVITDYTQKEEKENQPKSHSKNCAHQQRKTKMLPPCKSAPTSSPIIFDFFGKPYIERFPCYTGGLIKLQCHSISSKEKYLRRGNKLYLKNLASLSSIHNPELKAKIEEVKDKVYGEMNLLEEMYDNEFRIFKEQINQIRKLGGPNMIKDANEIWTVLFERFNTGLQDTVDNIFVYMNSLIEHGR